MRTGTSASSSGLGKGRTPPPPAVHAWTKMRETARGGGLDSVDGAGVAGQASNSQGEDPREGSGGGTDVPVTF